MKIPFEIEITEAARLLKIPGAAVLLDVREPQEWAFCHVEGSLHIPMRELPSRLAELPQDRQIFVICHHAERSQRVTQYLRANDYKLVSNVTGGIDAWAELIDTTLGRY